MSVHSLPSELWRTVFRYAVYVPFLLDTECDYQPGGTYWTGWDHTDDTAIATKRAIVQVCHAWKDLGMEFLYEVVSVPRYPNWAYRRLNLLTTVFKSSATGSKLGHGWWTKRIDCPREVLYEGSVDFLLSLMESCHNLRIFSVRYGGFAMGSVQTRLIRLLQSRFSHSLQRVDLEWEQPESSASLDPMSLFPIVRLTSLSIIYYTILLNHPGPLDITFQSITTLKLRFYDTPDTSLARWFFPRLQILSFTNIIDTYYLILRAFIELHHKTLVHLHIQTTGLDNEKLAFLIAPRPTSNLKIPSLSAAGRDVRSLAHSARKDDMPPVLGLKYLGIQRGGSGDFGKLCDHMKGLLEKGILPDLKVVRFMSRAAVLLGIHNWRRVNELFSHHNIQLEDVYGKSFAVSPEIAGSEI